MRSSTRCLILAVLSGGAFGAATATALVIKPASLKALWALTALLLAGSTYNWLRAYGLSLGAHDGSYELHAAGRGRGWRGWADRRRWLRHAKLPCGCCRLGGGGVVVCSREHAMEQLTLWTVRIGGSFEDVRELTKMADESVHHAYLRYAMGIDE